MLLRQLAARLNDHWSFTENIIFDFCHINIGIFRDYRNIGYILFGPGPIVRLKETEHASLIRFHILRVCACSIHPVNVEFITVGSEL